MFLNLQSFNLKVILILYSIGEFGIVYKGLLMNWNNIPVQKIAVKTLKGHTAICIIACAYLIEYTKLYIE